MSRKFLYFYCCAFSIVLMSCKKDSATGNTLASLTIVNAINGSNAIVTNFSLSNTKGNEQESFQYGLANQISDGSSFEIGSYVGITPLTISLITDTLGALWEGNLDLTAGTSNSFFWPVIQLTLILCLPGMLFRTILILAIVFQECDL